MPVAPELPLPDFLREPFKQVTERLEEALPSPDAKKQVLRAQYTSAVGPPTGVLSQPGRAVVAGERLVGHRRARGGGGHSIHVLDPEPRARVPDADSNLGNIRAQRRGRPISVGRRGGGGVAVPRAASDVHRQPVPRRTLAHLEAGT